MKLTFYNMLLGLILYMASSMHMSWGIWKIATDDKWTMDIDLNIFVLIIASWHMAVAVGSLVGSVLTLQVRKRPIYVNLHFYGLKLDNIDNIEIQFFSRLYARYSY